MPRRNAYQIDIAESAPDEGVSRSQRKRDCHRLQDLGASLLALSPTTLKRLPLPPVVLEAVLTAKAMKDERAKRRQIQYIGRVMREEVGDIRAIKDALGS